MTHTEDLDCPCRPVTREQVGGGRVQVHQEVQDGRQTPEGRAMDRYCAACDTWHLLGHPHFA